MRCVVFRAAVTFALFNLACPNIPFSIPFLWSSHNMRYPVQNNKTKEARSILWHSMWDVWWKNWHIYVFLSKYFGFPLSVITRPIINFHSSTIDYIQSAYRQHCSIYYKETSEITQCDPYGTWQKSFAHSAWKDRHYSRELGPHSFGRVAASTNHEPVFMVC